MPEPGVDRPSTSIDTDTRPDNICSDLDAVSDTFTALPSPEEMELWSGTKTATYAAVVTEFALDRWAGVPFAFVVAGE